MTRRLSRTALPARGFTLIEVLTVVGIIALLAGIVAVAFSVVGRNAASRRTAVAMESLLGMQTEYTKAVTLPSQLRTSMVSAADLDNNAAPGINPTANIAMRMRGDPNVSSALGKMSSGDLDSSLTCPVWVSGTNYDKDDLVSVGGVGYKALNAVTPSTTPPASDTANWSPASIPSSIQVPVDGWGKGMRFVGGGLTNVTVGGQSNQTITGSNGHPFWVSAGPDGSFENGDDNVYSFGN